MESCLLLIVSCTNNNCAESMIRKDLDKHVTTGCQWRLVQCSYCNEPHPKCQGEVIIIISFYYSFPSNLQHLASRSLYKACLILAYLGRFCIEHVRQVPGATWDIFLNPDLIAGVSKCFEVGGQLWKSRRLSDNQGATRPLKLGGSRVASDHDMQIK